MMAIRRYDSFVGTLGKVFKDVVRWLAKPRGAGGTRTHCKTPMHGPNPV